MTSEETLSQSDFQRFTANWLLRGLVAALAIAWLATTAWLFARTPAIPPVLTVERLEIVEPDGKPALVLANSRRPIAATQRAGAHGWTRGGTKRRALRHLFRWEGR